MSLSFDTNAKVIHYSIKLLILDRYPLIIIPLYSVIIKFNNLLVQKDKN